LGKAFSSLFLHRTLREERSVRPDSKTERPKTTSQLPTHAGSWLVLYEHRSSESVIFSSCYAILRSSLLSFLPGPRSPASG
jgi:hypothetical protein